eukprot:COSAG06_NODE_34995_length_466_cov_0.836512_1_plen_27_part_10
MECILALTAAMTVCVHRCWLAVGELRS